MGDVIKINAKTVFRALSRITDRYPDAPADRAYINLWIKYVKLRAEEKQHRESLQTLKKKLPRKHAPDDY